MSLQKKDGGLRPILCGEIWCRCFTGPAVKVSVFYDNLDTSDPNDPEVIIQIAISNVFNSYDVLSGYASRDYACDLKQKEIVESTCVSLSNMFGYFHVMRSLSYDTDTLTGTDRFTSRRAKRGDNKGTPQRFFETTQKPSTTYQERLPIKTPHHQVTSPT